MKRTTIYYKSCGNVLYSLFVCENGKSRKLYESKGGLLYKGFSELLSGIDKFCRFFRVKYFDTVSYRAI